MFKKRFSMIGAILMLWIAPAGISTAADEVVVRDSTQNVQTQRVEKLEGELAELKRLLVAQQREVKTMQQQRQAAPAPVAAQEQKKAAAAPAAPQQEKKAVPVSAAPQAVSEPNTLSKLTAAEIGKLRQLLELDQTKKKPVWSGLDIQLYGYLKADASYDTDRTNPGNYVLYVDSYPNNKNDDEFNLTANQTRLGLKIGGPDDSVVKTSGLLEFDFYGNYADENKAKIQMRHAWLKMDWPDKLSVIAGQASDVISPLLPETLNYTVLWDGGNIGYRRPQIRLTKGFVIAKDTELQVEAAAARTIGRTSTIGSVASESGEDAGFPTAQGRVSLTFPGVGYKPTTIGFSGHYGREEYDTSLAGATKQFDSWSTNIDITQPVNKWLTVKGEAFTGLNLNSYLGGVGQGVNTTTNKEIAAKGGWVAASFGPWGNWRFNNGVGIDQADRDDLTNGGRTLNRSIFGNAICSVGKNTEVGFEVSHWRTAYKNSDEMDDLRVQTSFIHKF